MVRVLALQLEEVFKEKAKEKQQKGINQFSLIQKSEEAPIKTRKELSEGKGIQKSEDLKKKKRWLWF